MSKPDIYHKKVGGKSIPISRKLGGPVYETPAEKAKTAKAETKEAPKSEAKVEPPKSDSK